MAKKSKNSKQQVHYARTMTPENLSRAANYVGNYILKGLGAFGKIMTAPLIGSPQGPATVILPKTKEQLGAERKLRETQEEQIGKAMTWVSPLNYGAALMTGNGLNAKKGEEEVASWSPAWQAAARLGELYVGPKGVKAVKAAPKTVVNVAAKAGVKPAKAAVVAREIKQATKNKPNIEVPSPTEYNVSDNIILYRANPTNIKNLSYKGERYGDTSGQYVGKWFTDEPSKPNWYASNMAKRGEEPAYYQVTVPKYWAKKQKASHKISNPSIEYEPEDYIIEDGINRLQGQLYQGRPGTIQYLQQNFQTPVIKEPSTSLKFFERKPSKLTEAERKGFSKGKEYYTKEQNKSFLKQINDFAEKYGYTGLKEGDYTSEQLNAYARALIDRHNKFYRGVVLPIGEDLNLVKNVLGNKATNEQILQHVATHSRGKDINPELYMSPTTNAFSYGASGKTAIISRPYKLGKDRTKWFDEGDFNIVETGTVNPKSYNNFQGIVYPWESPRFQIYDPFRSKKIIPENYKHLTSQDIAGGEGYYEYVPNPYVQNELISINNPMIFRQWVKSPTLETLSKKTPNVPWQLSKIVVEKQGGKMNILKFLKNGSGIHIKEKNKGKFTSYCGGKVTDECIQKGKNSSNPAIRKRATFAQNARHFKHKKGGIIKAEDGTKTNFFQKAGNWISNNKDLVNSITNAGLGIVSNIKQNKAIDAQIEANEKQAEVNKQQAFMNNYKEALGMQSDRSDIVNRNKAWQIANSQNYSDDELQNKNLQLQQSKVGILDSLGGLSTDILNAFSNNKKSSSNNPPSDSYFGNYVKTQFKNPGTFNSDGSFNTSLGTYKWEDGKLKNISNTYGTFNVDGSMNLGNGLGTFSIKDGYKPRKFGILNS